MKGVNTQHPELLKTYEDEFKQDEAPAPTLDPKGKAPIEPCQASPPPPPEDLEDSSAGDPERRIGRFVLTQTSVASEDTTESMKDTACSRRMD
jgi:hypothetical protein